MWLILVGSFIISYYSWYGFVKECLKKTICRRAVAKYEAKYPDGCKKKKEVEAEETVCDDFIYKAASYKTLKDEVYSLLEQIEKVN